MGGRGGLGGELNNTINDSNKTSLGIPTRRQPTRVQLSASQPDTTWQSSIRYEAPHHVLHSVDGFHMPVPTRHASCPAVGRWPVWPCPRTLMSRHADAVLEIMVHGIQVPPAAHRTLLISFSLAFASICTFACQLSLVLSYSVLSVAASYFLSPPPCATAFGPPSCFLHPSSSCQPYEGTLVSTCMRSSSLRRYRRQAHGFASWLLPFDAVPG